MKKSASKSAKSSKKSTKVASIDSVKLTPAEKRKRTIAAKKAAKAEQVHIEPVGDFREPETDLSELSEVEAATVTQAISDSVVGEPAAADLETSAKKGTAEWAATEAKSILGPDAIVWSVTHDAKGKQFPAPRYRVGMPSDKDTGYLIESGRLIIGAGTSYSGAVSDARKRTAGHLTPAVKTSDVAGKVAAEYVADGNVAPEDAEAFAAEVEAEMEAGTLAE